jgi:tetratricopeptide (TPR) repeat protein
VTNQYEREKLNELYKKAMSLHNRGDYESALKIWNTIKKSDSKFEGIDRCIFVTSQKINQSKSVTNSSAYRTQRNLMTQDGRGPRKRVFQPFSTHVSKPAKIRHRHIVLILLVVFLGLFYLSARNNRTHMIVLNPKTNNLDFYQGNFFPYGWQKSMELEIGIEHDWVAYVENREIIQNLQKGVIVRSRDSLNELIIDTFMTLGDESARQMTERAQQSAIYYYRRVYDASFEDRVVEKIVKSFVNLARIKIIAEDYRLAERYLESANRYDNDAPDLLMVQKELENARKGDDYYF